MKKKMKLIAKAIRESFIAGPLDYNLFFTIVFLNVYGIIMIYSASYNNTISRADYFFKGQFKNVMIGMAAIIIISFLDYHRVLKLFWGAGWGTFMIIFSLLLLTPLAVSELGATRWIKIGPISFQAAEPIKASAILFYAWYIKKIGLNTLAKQLFAFAFAIGSGGLLFVLSNNLSTAIVLVGMSVCMIMISLRKRELKIYSRIAIVLCLLLVLIFLVPALLDVGGDFRHTRIRAWFNPEEYASDQGLQAMQAKYAIGAGGIWGKGIGQSLIKYKLPYAYNDFILAIICEELGVFGVTLMLILFGYMLYRIYITAVNAWDIEGKLICIGVFAQVAIQLILNIMVVTSLFPTTGVTLPFFSAGGTSVLFLLAELGLVLNIDKYAKDRRFREEAERYVERQEQRGGIGPAGWKRRLSDPSEDDE